MNSQSNSMSSIVEIIRQQISNPYITNAEMARLCGMSERQFYIKTEEKTGMSPNLYLRELRLDKATELLTSGAFSTIKEVALRVGFLKVSYFSNLYLEREGLRPTEVLIRPEI